MSAATFLSPEGSYTLAYEVLPPPPPTPIGSGNNNAAAALAAAHALQEHPATFVTAIVTFPPITQSSGLLGLGSSQKTTRAREASFSTDASSFSPLTQNASLGPSDEASSSTSTNSLQDSGPGSSQMQSMLGQSPVAGKRRPLMSLPSMPSMPLSSFGNNSGQASTPLTSKPKNAFRGTTSTFVKSYEGLPLSARVDKLWAGQDAREVTLAAFTCGKTVFISDISLRAKSRDPIVRLQFGAIPTCLSINQSTLSHDRLDLLIGFASGDLMWIEAFSGRYTRYNKEASVEQKQGGGSGKNASNGSISSTAVKQIHWSQGDQLFASAFHDGSIAFWDKDKEDPSSFTASPGLAPQPGAYAAPPDDPESRPSLERVNSNISQEGHTSSSEKGRSRLGPYMAPVEEYTGDIIVTLPPTGNDKKNANKFNPVAHWKVSRKAINDFAFSPDYQYCAVVGEDGCLRIIDTASQRLLDTFQGYFGALTCVSWSPDGRFVLTGGQDDLACVWSPFEQRIIARCEGHASFLTGLSFDAWRCDSRTQRFASVSEDCRLILWDLSSAALQRPKAHHHHHHHHHHSHLSHHAQPQSGPYARRASAVSSLSLVRRRTIESSANLPLTGTSDREGPLWHRAPNRSEVPGLQPVLVKQISVELLSGITFLPNMIVTISRNSTLKVWLRPEQRF